VRLADFHGFSYDRRDVTGRQIASAYARTLGAIFTDQTKPFEVEICVAEVGASSDDDQLYRITYDGSVQDEPGVVVMGGQAESLVNGLREKHRGDLGLSEGLKLAVAALASVGGENGNPRDISAGQLEVAVLDRHRSGRTFRRLTGLALTALLEASSAAEEAAAEEEAPQPPKSEVTPADNASGGSPAPADDAPTADGDAPAAGDTAAAGEAPAADDSSSTEEPGESGE
jgi:proteasome alpha subunit